MDRYGGIKLLHVYHSQLDQMMGFEVDLRMRV